MRYLPAVAFCLLFFTCEKDVVPPSTASGEAFALRVDSFYNAGTAIMQTDYDRARPLVQRSFLMGYENGQDSLVGMRKVKVATYVVYTGKLAEGRRMIREVLERARQDGPRELLVNALSEMVQVEAYFGSPDSVDYYLAQTLATIDTVNAPTQHANYLRRRGELAKMQLDMTGATAHYTKALEIYDKHGNTTLDSSATAGILLDLGLCLSITGSHEKAYAYFKRVLTYFEPGEPAYANVAARVIPTAAILRDNEAAARLIEEVLDQPDATEQEIYLAYTGRALLAFNRGDYSLAVRESLRLDTMPTDDPSIILTKLILRAESFIHLNRFPEARTTVAELQKAAYIDAQRETADLLSLQLDVLEAGGVAIREDLERLISLRDSVSRRDQYLALAETEAKYRTALKDRKIAEAQTRLSDAELERKQLQTVGLIIGLLTMGLFAGVMVYRKNNHRLDALNIELAQSATVRGEAIKALREKNVALDSANQALEASRKRVEVLNEELNHRVKNNLAVMTSVFQMQSRRTTNEEVKDLLSRMEARVQTLNEAYVMLQHRVNGEHLLSTALFFENLTEKLKSFYEEKEGGLRVDLSVAEVVISSSDLVYLGLIVNELISNTVKHTDRVEGRRTATLAFQPHGEVGYELIYRDHAGEIPDWRNVQVNTRQSLGTKLIDVLASNLGAEVEVLGGEVRVWRPIT